MSPSTMSARAYAWVFLALLVLAALTVGISHLDLGVLNVAAALAIAALKAALVVLFFMHVHASRKAVWLFAAAGFFWLALLGVLVLGDVLTRRWLPPPGSAAGFGP